MSLESYWGCMRYLAESEEDLSEVFEDRFQSLLQRCYANSLAQSVCADVSGFRPDVPTRRAYVYEGQAGWTAAFWSGSDEVRFLHGFPSSAIAVRAVCAYYEAPPDFQHGFNTVVPYEVER